MPSARGYIALEDGALVALVGEGDVAALEALYARYGRVAYALARRIVGEPGLARGVVQEIFLEVWHDTTRYDSPRGGFASWLLAVTHQRSVEMVRREENLRRRRSSADVLDFAETTPSRGDDEVFGLLRRQRVRAALAELPEAHREELALAYFGGYTQREIAQLAHAPLGAVQTRMLASLRLLRDALDTADDAAGRSSR